MSVLDEVTDAGPNDATPSPPALPPDEPEGRRRWLVYLVLAVVLFWTVVGIVLFGINDASAAGGCGGG